MATRWDFWLPTRVLFGRGGLRRLGPTAKPWGKKALLVGYAERGPLEAMYQKAIAWLTGVGVAVVEYFAVEPEPSAETVEDAAQLARDTQVDVVIGLGGGSVIDAAKAVALLVAQGGRLEDYTDNNPQARPIEAALPVVAVPTTAGTGSEITSIAVVGLSASDSFASEPCKASLVADVLRPAVALVDPDLTLHCPARLTAACGVDALGHAVEACMSRRANPMTTTLATRAVQLLVDFLPRAVEDMGDADARESVALAATLAGAAFNEAGVTLGHAVAQALGALLHIAHGEAVALGLPLVLHYNAEVCTDVFSDLAVACGISGDTAESRAAAFVEHLLGLLRTLGLPQRLEWPSEDGGRPMTSQQWAARVAENAHRTTPVPLKLNPRKIDEATLRELIEKRYAY